MSCSVSLCGCAISIVVIPFLISFGLSEPERSSSKPCERKGKERFETRSQKGGEKNSHPKGLPVEGNLHIVSHELHELQEVDVLVGVAVNLVNKGRGLLDGDGEANFAEELVEFLGGEEAVAVAVHLEKE